MRTSRELTFTYKFSRWRRYITGRFFPNVDRNLRDVEKVFPLAEKGYKIELLVWGVTLEEEGLEIEHPNVRILRLEDGFIRSVGLGIRLTPPISLVADSRGIYYNSQKPSDLEHILSETDFEESLKERAKNLIRMLLERKVTKYNIPEKRWRSPKTDRKIIIVPGQVETDMSIKYGLLF